VSGRTLLGIGGLLLVGVAAWFMFGRAGSTSDVNEWSKQFGSSANDAVDGIAVDSDGNVVVTGVFHGSVDFGGGALVGLPTNAAYIAKYSADGRHLWSKAYPVSIAALTTDASGAIVFAGSFVGQVDVGGGSIQSTGRRDAIVVKLSPAGSYQWSRQFGSAEAPAGSYSSGTAVAAGSNGEVVVTGQFDGFVDFGKGLQGADGEGGGIFLVKLSSQGETTWSKTFGDGDSDSGLAVTVDRDGDIWTTGHFQGDVDFGGGWLAGSRDYYTMFIAKFRADGTHAWSKHYSSQSRPAYGKAIAADAAGNIVVTGASGGFDLGGGLIGDGTIRNIEMFIAKFSKDGAHMWSHSFAGGTDNDMVGEALSIVADSIVVTGGFAGRTEMCGQPMVSAGNRDALLAQFSSTGECARAVRVGGTGFDSGRAVAIDRGAVVWGGVFEDVVPVNGLEPMRGAGESDGFLVRQIF
jgi:hypothetical protein